MIHTTTYDRRLAAAIERGAYKLVDGKPVDQCGCPLFGGTFRTGCNH